LRELKEADMIFANVTEEMTHDKAEREKDSCF